VFFFRGGNAHLALSAVHGLLSRRHYPRNGRLEAIPYDCVREPSHILGINLVLAIIPDKRGFVWRTDSEAIPTSADLLFSAFGRLWMVIGAGIVIPFLAWNVSRQSSRFDRLLGNLAYPLYLFHWIPREWYYHFSLSSDPTWKQCALLAINFFSAGTGALAILFLVDRRSERLQAAWIASRRKKLPVSMPEVGTATLEQMKPY
jgi:hypothetical protein